MPKAFLLRTFLTNTVEHPWGGNLGCAVRNFVLCLVISYFIHQSFYDQIS